MKDKWINYFLFGFLVFIMVYHLISTFLVWKLWFNKYLVSLSKDVLWIWFVLAVLVVNFSKLKNFIKDYFYLIVVFVLLIIISMTISLVEGLSLKQIVIWFKYDIWPLVVVLTALFIGYKIAEVQKLDFVKKFFIILFCFIAINLFVWLTKILFPSFYQYFLWFWPIANFSPGNAPPVYYTNWDWGIPRFSGFFSGPNNLWFFLVAFFPFLFYVSKKFFSKKIFYITNFFVLINWILTLSRWWILGTFVEILILFKNKILKHIWLSVFWLLGLFFLWIFLVNIRDASTFDHARLTSQAVSMMKEHPLWYWLGMYWPSSFYLNESYKQAKEFVPENTYLQIFLNTWILWWILWLFFWILLIYYSKKYKKNDVLWNVKWYLMIGLIWLAIEGMFLHVFDDSMLVYLYLVVLGYVLAKD